MTNAVSPLDRPRDVGVSGGIHGDAAAIIGWLPPKYVEYTSAEPPAFSLATKPSGHVSSHAMDEMLDCIALTVGKFVDWVIPVT